jgi:hypothetical protein
MRRIRFYVGTQQGTTNGDGSQLTWDEFRSVYEWLSNRYGGYTAQSARGGWIDPSGKLVNEPSLIIEVLDNDPTRTPTLRDPKRVAGKIKSLLHQDCVLYTVEEIQGGFV